MAAPLPGQCCDNVEDGGPTLNQHRVYPNVATCVDERHAYVTRLRALGT